MNLLYLCKYTIHFYLCSVRLNLRINCPRRAKLKFRILAFTSDFSNLLISMWCIQKPSLITLQYCSDYFSIIELMCTSLRLWYLDGCRFIVITRFPKPRIMIQAYPGVRRKLRAQLGPTRRDEMRSPQSHPCVPTKSKKSPLDLKYFISSSE